jgi:hypothetical protein
MHNSIPLIGCLIGLVVVQSFVPSFRHEFRPASASVVSLAAAKKRKRKQPPVTTTPGTKVDVALTQQPVTNESVAKDTVEEEVDKLTIAEIANFKFEPDDTIRKGMYICVCTCENVENERLSIMHSYDGFRSASSRYHGGTVQCRWRGYSRPAAASGH